MELHLRIYQRAVWAEDKLFRRKLICCTLEIIEEDYGGSIQIKVRQPLRRFDGMDVLFPTARGEASKMGQNERDLRIRSNNLEAVIDVRRMEEDRDF